MDHKIYAKELLDFIYESPTAFHVVENVEKELVANGFEELCLADYWKLVPGGKYFVKRNGTTVIAFSIGSTDIEKSGFKIVGGHSDFPSIRIKSNPEMVAANGYVKLNIETYGGLMTNTWLDRPLGFAGRVSLKGSGFAKPVSKIFNIKKPMVTIPNQGTLMNPKINSGGYEYNKQNDLLPLFATLGDNFDKNKCFIKMIAKEIDVNPDDILDYEIYMYDFNKGCLVGANEEFISSSRLDNLSTVYAGLKSFVETPCTKGINMLVAFDHEEIGNRSKQGSDSPLLRNVMERIGLCFGKTKEEMMMSVYRSFLVSSDVAHGVHPNAEQKHDPTNKPVLNKGVVIKTAAAQCFTTDSNTFAAFKSMCDDNGVPTQRFIARADGNNGFTLAPASASQIDIDSIDIGVALLAMHSINELGGVYDCYNLKKSFDGFYGA